VEGRLVRGEGNTWPLTLADRSDDMPVNLRVLQLGQSGEGEVYADNNDIIEDLLASQFGMSPDIGGDPMDPRVRSSGACSVTSARAPWGHSAAVVLLGLAGIAALRRRRSA
jgi:MYXO-CTERM domain-containing protein